MFDTVRKLLSAKGGQSADALRRALDTIDISALTSAFEAAEASRREALLTGTDSELAAAERELSKARIELDRGRAAAEELERRIAAATTAEAEAAWARERAAVERQAEQAAKRLAEVYPAASSEIIAALEQVAKAQATVDAYNRRMIAADRGEPFVGDVEPRCWPEAESWKNSEAFRAAALTSLRPTPTTAGYGQGALAHRF
jgi:hypothetical protein